MMSTNGNSLYYQAGRSFSQSHGAKHLSIIQGKMDEDAGGVAGRPSLFSGILSSDYKEILAAARVREFARGEILYMEGDSIQQILMLTSGLVKITKIALSGTEVILRLGGPGDVFGAADPLSAGRHSTT